MVRYVDGMWSVICRGYRVLKGGLRGCVDRVRSELCGRPPVGMPKERHVQASSDNNPPGKVMHGMREGGLLETDVGC